VLGGFEIRSVHGRVLRGIRPSISMGFVTLR
jgi:hypothetical protein